jgi:hypothetical protein
MNQHTHLAIFFNGIIAKDSSDGWLDAGGAGARPAQGGGGKKLEGAHQAG